LESCSYKYVFPKPGDHAISSWGNIQSGSTRQRKMVCLIKEGKRGKGYILLYFLLFHIVLALARINAGS